MIRIFKGLLLVAAIIIGIFLFNYIEQEDPVVRSLPVQIQSKLHAQNETKVSLSQIPLPLQQAVIDTEDHSFYTNSGVSLEGILRSLVTDLSSESFQEGGSTITQQLAKNQILGDERSVSRKLREIILAFMITRDFSKQDILAMYLNSVYYGHGAWGIDAAARVYFNKPVSKLTFSQSTLMAGLPQSPSYFDPLINYQAARTRQQQVIQSMIQAGDLEQDRASEIMNMPLALHN